MVIDRPSSLGLSELGTSAVAGVSVRECGVGALRQTEFTFNDFYVTMTDAGTTGYAGSLIYTFPAGAILPLGGVGSLTVTASSGSLAGVSIGLGSTQNADNTISGNEENIMVESGTVTATTATALTVKQGTANTAVIDGTSTNVPCYFNINSTGDPGTGQTLKFNGTIVVTWVNLGDC